MKNNTEDIFGEDIFGEDLILISDKTDISELKKYDNKDLCKTEIEELEDLTFEIKEVINDLEKEELKILKEINTLKNKLQKIKNQKNDKENLFKEYLRLMCPF